MQLDSPAPPRGLKWENKTYKLKTCIEEKVKIKVPILNYVGNSRQCPNWLKWGRQCTHFTSISAPFHEYLKQLKTSGKGKKSKQGFVVTPGNRNWNFPHIRPRTDWLTLELSRPKTWLEQVNLRMLIVYTPLDYYRLEARAGWALSIVYSDRENLQMRFAMKSLKDFQIS